MKIKSSFSYALFGVAFLLALVNSFQTTEYVSNIAKAAIVPLFLISIIDFFNKIKDKAAQILLSKIEAEHADYREAKAIYDSIANLEDIDTEGKVKGWRENMERHSKLCIHYHLIDMQIGKYYKGYLPMYTMAALFLLLSMLLAQSEEWIYLLSKINSDTITLWTFAILLLDVTFEDFFANKLISFAKKRCNYKEE